MSPSVLDWTDDRFYDTVLTTEMKRKQVHSIFPKRKCHPNRRGRKRKGALVLLLYFGPGTERSKLSTLIHGVTAMRSSQWKCRCHSRPEGGGGGVKIKRERERWGGKKVAREWLLKSPPPLITLCTAAAHRAAWHWQLWEWLILNAVFKRMIYAIC